jgi:dGTPase
MVRSEIGLPKPTLAQLCKTLNDREAGILASQATLSRAGCRRHSELHLETGYRQSFAVDADRILHSRAYARYIDKTQVFSLVKNDHITHRVLHVQLVSKIARTIGRFLSLNEDLIEAIALGHDIGHTPFGHDGERFLSQLCQQAGIGAFLHNVQSIQFLDRVERKGTGWNLCLQTLDGILCHDGEIHNRLLIPQKEKTFGHLSREMAEKKENPDLPLTPMTLEGCVVRMADTIAYVGRDLEDAIRLGVLERLEIPKDVTDVLGNTNGTIVYALVTDIIQNSSGQPHICFSQPISDALKRLKAFNLERIYLNKKLKSYVSKVKKTFEILFEQYLKDLDTGNRESPIFAAYLQDISQGYLQEHSHPEIVRDYIAGMTDSYFMRQSPYRFND